MSFMLVAPGAIVTAMDTSATPRSTSGNFPARASAGPSPAVSPTWSASLRSSTAPACPIRPSPPPVTSSAWSHRVSCVTKRAPAWESERCGYLRNLPEPGRFSLLNRSRHLRVRRRTGA